MTIRIVEDSPSTLIRGAMRIEHDVCGLVRDGMVCGGDPNHDHRHTWETTREKDHR